MASLLPSHPGLLPYWNLLGASLSIFNCAMCFIAKRPYALRTYQGSAAASQVTDYGARMFGTWTLLASVIRIYSAYKIDNRDLYLLALWTYFVALAHFVSELVVYGTMRPGRGLAPVLGFASVSVCWMVAQWGFYVGS